MSPKLRVLAGAAGADELAGAVTGSGGIRKNSGFGFHFFSPQPMAGGAAPAAPRHLAVSPTTGCTFKRWQHFPFFHRITDTPAEQRTAGVYCRHKFKKLQWLCNAWAAALGCSFCHDATARNSIGAGSIDCAGNADRCGRRRPRRNLGCTGERLDRQGGRLSEKCPEGRRFLGRLPGVQRRRLVPLHFGTVKLW